MNEEPREEKRQRFTRLFSELQPVLLSSLSNIIQDSESAKDIIQNTAMVLWEKYPDVDDSIRFRKIAFTVMRYEILSFRRDKARSRVIFDEHVIQLLVDESTVSPPRMSLEQELLEKHIAGLPPEEKKLLFEAYQPDIQINLMAEESGKSPMALYKKLQKIRSKLLNNIQEELKQNQESK